MSWIVSTEVINPYGICLGEDLPQENYTPYVDPWAREGRWIHDEPYIEFSSYQGLTHPDDEHFRTYYWRFYPGNVLRSYIRRVYDCLLYTSPSPRDRQKSRMPSSA